MTRYRSVLSFILAAIALFLVSCSSPQAVKAPTYSEAQIAQIQDYTVDLQELRDRLTDIPTLVQRKKWMDVSTLIHGPLGELRRKMSGITRNLSPDLQAPAKDAVSEVFEGLVLIDEAATAQDAEGSLAAYRRTIRDYDAFLNLIPSFADQAA